MTLTDEQIADLVQTGDTEQFGELIERYEAKLKRYARRFLSYSDEIDDLVQDVFVKSYTNIKSFDTEQRFSPWIYRIAHNTFVNELRRKQRGVLPLFELDTILPAKETADEETLSAELKLEMDELVSKVPSKYREVLILYYYEELSYKEIGEVLQISVSTVGIRMNRARKKLKTCFDEEAEKHKGKTT